MTTRRFLSLALLGAALAACAGDDSSFAPAGTGTGDGSPAAESGEAGPSMPDGRPHVGGQTGGEAGLRCTDGVPLEPIALDTRTVLGYSPADIIAGLAAEQHITLEYAEGGMAGLELTLAYDGPVAFAATCNRIELDVTLGFSSSDGGFAEVLHGRLFASSPDAAALRVVVPAEAVVGDYVRSHAATLPTGPLALTFEFEFTSAAVQGSIDATPAAGAEGDRQSIASF